MKSLLLLISILVLTVTMVLGLFLFTHHQERVVGNFSRTFPSRPFLDSSFVDIKLNSYYIAGASASHVFLGNRTAPLHLVVLNSSTLDTQHVNVRLAEDAKLINAKMVVQGSTFFLVDQVSANVAGGTVGEWRASLLLASSVPFSEAQPIGIHSMIFRAFHSKTKAYEIGKHFSDSAILDTTLLERQLDGIFCSDGSMAYDHENYTFVYLYTYRNEFIQIDTGLNLIGRGRTIDGIDRVNITVAQLKSSSTTTLSSPPLIVNKKASLSGNWLLVNSNILGQNESEEVFDRVAVIDVYDLETSSYHLSFYLPGVEDIRNYKLLGNKLFVIRDHFLIKYTLREGLFDMTPSATTAVIRK